VPVAEDTAIASGPVADRLPLVEAELEVALAHARAELAVVRNSLATVVTYLARPS
jgi:hypothetical protein